MRFEEVVLQMRENEGSTGTASDCAMIFCIVFQFAIDLWFREAEWKKERKFHVYETFLSSLVRKGSKGSGK